VPYVGTTIVNSVKTSQGSIKVGATGASTKQNRIHGFHSHIFLSKILKNRFAFVVIVKSKTKKSKVIPVTGFGAL
jgi:hypothetical protein